MKIYNKKGRSFIAIPILCLFMLYCNTKPQNSNAVTTELADRALKIIQGVLHSQSEWVKVHAAEYLIWAGHPQGVKEIYLQEEKLLGNKSQYRIGIWRVLAQVSDNAEEKQIWTGKIMNAFLDRNGTDRIHAAETLAKLRVSPALTDSATTIDALNSDQKSLSYYTKWSTAFNSENSFQSVRDDFYELLMNESTEMPSIKLAAFVLRNSGSQPDEKWERLARYALSKPEGYDAFTNILSAALVTAPESKINSPLYSQIKKNLLSSAKAPNKGTRMENAMALAAKGSADDIPVLISMMEGEDPIGIEADDADVRATAAYAIISISRRIN